MPFCPLLKLKINLSKTETGVLWSVQKSSQRSNGHPPEMLHRYGSQSFSSSSHGTKVKCSVSCSHRVTFYMSWLRKILAFWFL